MLHNTVTLLFFTQMYLNIVPQLPGPCVMSSLYDITEGRVGDLVTLPCNVTCPDGNVKWSKVDELELAVDCAQGICVERLDFENRTALSTENISLNINPLRLQDVGMFIASCNGKEVCDVKLKVVRKC